MKALPIIIVITLLSLGAQAQMMFEDPYRQEVSTDYTVELAIEYDGKLLSEWSFSKNKLSLGMGMHGDITLKILDAAKRITCIETPKFRIAIKDTKTGTIRMYSDEAYSEINAETLVGKCKEGESLIIMTIDRKYALRNNEIELMLGC